MSNVLPSQAGLSIDGVYYRYTIEKQQDSDATVYIRNKYALGDGYVYNHEDNWNGLRGNTLVGYDQFASISGLHFGNGEIGVDGQGTLTNVTVSYTYKLDLCYNPLADPSCPGFRDALYQWLLDNGLIGSDVDINDPYLDEWVQKSINEKTEQEEKQDQQQAEEEPEDKEEISIEEALSIGGAAEKIADTAQQQVMMQALAAAPKLDSYYGVTISGGTYQETVVLKDKNLPDNKRALRNLAQQQLHREMVRSQYNLDGQQQGN